MIALIGRLRLWAPRIVAVLLVPLLALAAGCGSSSGDGTTDAAAPARAGGEDSGQAIVRKPAGKTDRGQEKNGTGASRPAASGRDGEGAKKASEQGAKPKPASGSPSQPQSGQQKVSKACPSGISRSECETLVAGYQQTKDKASHAVKEPEDCLRAMSRAECEGLLEGQQEAAEEGGASVDVRQCLRNPTPRCQEILRAAFEAQVAAGATGK